MNLNGVEDDWSQSYKNIKSAHDNAYHAIVEAIKLEEQEKPADALAQYKLGIALIDEALITPVALPDDDIELDETWTRGLRMIQKMKRTRADIVLRVGAITHKLNPTDGAAATADDSQSGIEGRPRTFGELGEALRNLQYTIDDIPNSLDLLFLCEGVKLYHIAKSGEVTTTDDSSTMRIVRLDKDPEKNLQASHFMQIIRSSSVAPIIAEPLSDDDSDSDNGLIDGEATALHKATAILKQERAKKIHEDTLIYPLVPGASPCYLTEYGAFIFPDLESSVPGAAIGLLIPDEYAELALEIFEAILHGVVKQARPPASLAGWADITSDEHARARRALSEQISCGIVRGAGHLSNGLVKGSERVGAFITSSTPYIISKLNRAPENAPPVSGRVVGGVELAKSATGVAVNVTGYVAGKVGSATMALGRFLAPHVQCQGSKLLARTTGMDADKAADTMSGVLTIAAGAVEGFGTVYSGLEQSASILGSNLSNNSVQIIEHKYGPSAGNVAAETFDTVGNIINVNRNMRLLTPKGLATRSMKNAGKAIVSDFRPGTSRSNYVQAGDLYPDLSKFSQHVGQPKI